MGSWTSAGVCMQCIGRFSFLELQSFDEQIRQQQYSDALVCINRLPYGIEPVMNLYSVFLFFSQLDIFLTDSSFRNVFANLYKYFKSSMQLPRFCRRRKKKSLVQQTSERTSELQFIFSKYRWTVESGSCFSRRIILALICPLQICAPYPSTSFPNELPDFTDCFRGYTGD